MTLEQKPTCHRGVRVDFVTRGDPAVGILLGGLIREELRDRNVSALSHFNLTLKFWGLVVQTS